MEEERIQTQEQLLCFHCGQEAPNDTFKLEEKVFCCVGCQSVYLLLHEHKLHNYYRYNHHPGKASQQNDNNLDFLDDQKIERQLIDFQNEEVTMITFYIPAIHCSSCVWLLENLYKINPAITAARTDFMKKQVSLTFRHKEISLKQLVALLSSIGYDPLITLQDVVKEKKNSHNNRLIRQIAVAGFCFGNSMMMSFPEYFGMSQFERQFSSLFGYINLSFTLPAMLYSGKDYFSSAWHSLQQRKLNLDVPLALGIFILFLRSAIDIIGGHGIGFSDTLCGLVFFLLAGKWVQQRTFYHLSFERDYRSYFPVAVTKIEDGQHKSIPLADLKEGDRLVVRNNEIIPADAILLKGSASIDFSFVTGESQEVPKTLGEIIYAGGRQMGQAIEVEVVKSVSQSYLTKLWNNDQYQDEGVPFQSFSNTVSQYFTPILLALSLGAALFWIIMGDGHRAWSAFTAILIIACPCALALSSPFTLSAALSIFDKNKCYVKNTITVEKFAAIDQFVFDKTGTITSPKAIEIGFQGNLSDEERLMVASVCHNSTHPLSREIVKSIHLKSPLPVDGFEELSGKGIQAMVNGQQVQVGSADFLGAVSLPTAASESGHVHIGINGDYKGYFQLNQTWRAELSDVVYALKTEYDLHLLSGDSDRMRNALAQVFPKSRQLHFSQSPKDKLLYIQHLQSQGQRVCMLGDGLNDAAALKQANVGIAISDDINNFSPGCDAILDGQAFGKLPQFMRFSKDTLKVIHSSFMISFTYNIVGLSLAMQGTMSPLFAAVLMPLSTVTIISFTSIATRLYARKNNLTVNV